VETTVKVTRSNLGYLLSGAGAALLFLFLFLSWFGASGAFGGSESRSAWQTFSVCDVVLALLALATLAAVATEVLAGVSGPAWFSSDLIKWFAAIALTITLAFMLEFSSGDIGKAIDLKIGAWLSLLACLAMVAGAVLSNRPDLAARVAGAAGVDDGGARPAARAPAGLGSSSSAGTPTGGGAPGLGSTAPGSAGAGAPGGASAGAAAGAAGGTSTGGGSAGAAAGGGPPAGWYPDPQGQARLRYWDGAGWTDQTSA
jgi:hypothetical protein